MTFLRNKQLGQAVVRAAIAAMIGIVSAVPCAAQTSSWEKYSGKNFSFAYPFGWKLKGSGSTEVSAIDPQDGKRWVGVSFQPGMVNRGSLAQQCQTVNDILLDIARAIQQAAESMNQANQAGPFDRLQVTFEGPHPGNPGTIGGRNIRISTVQNRGGFEPVKAWDMWVTGVARGDGIYLVAMENPRSDRLAQETWDRFVRSVTFTGGRIASSGCP
jgi:hypothetical protein